MLVIDGSLILAIAVAICVPIVIFLRTSANKTRRTQLMEQILQRQRQLDWEVDDGCAVDRINAASSPEDLDRYWARRRVINDLARDVGRLGGLDQLPEEARRAVGDSLEEWDKG